MISPARRARAVSALLAIQGLASAISVPLVAVLADVGGWRFAFIVYGLVLAAGTAGELVLASKRPQGASSQPGILLQV